HLAAQLGGDFGWTVSERGMAVDDAADQLRQGDCFTLRLARDVAQPVNERHVGVQQMIRRGLDRVVHRRRPAVDQGVRIEALGGVVLEPRFAQAAGPLGLDDLLTLGVQLDVVADAAAEGAGGVFYDGQSHCLSSDWSEPEALATERTTPTFPARMV